VFARQENNEIARCLDATTGKEIWSRQFNGRPKWGYSGSVLVDGDLAIVTGMTIFNDSLEEIVEVAQSRGTKLLMFCETGANFAEEYCRSIGVDTVVSELFPFYIFQGTSTIEVYRRA
jgi:outer membrane protein assembly factor BamB